MNSLEKMIHRQRKQKYKDIRKLFKARDMASEFVIRTVKVSDIRRGMSDTYLYNHTVSEIAKCIVDLEGNLLSMTRRPPSPPPQGPKPIK